MRMFPVGGVDTVLNDGCSKELNDSHKVENESKKFW